MNYDSRSRQCRTSNSVQCVVATDLPTIIVNALVQSSILIDTYADSVRDHSLQCFDTVFRVRGRENWPVEISRQSASDPQRFLLEDLRATHAA